MTGPQRHQLRRLTAAGWQAVVDRPWDDEARAGIALWAARDLPLVVSRQPAGMVPGRLAMGLPAPAAFGRRRLAIEVQASQTRLHAGFPRLEAVAALLTAGSAAAWRSLIASLTRLAVDARVYGSHGWQVLTGLDHLHRDSDIDLLLPVNDGSQADAVCACLAGHDVIGLRLDGELIFADGAGVSWREWSTRHRSAARGVLVKRMGGVGIEPIAAAPEAAPC